MLIGVYLAGLRHPRRRRTARHLSQIAPGRLILGVGVGGEDRTEVTNAGVDPATRGRRLDETLEVLRRLATGEAVDHDGEFFPSRGPHPASAGPAGADGHRRRGRRRRPAHRRARRRLARHLLLGPPLRRDLERIRDATAERGRAAPSWFGLNVWCGLGSDGDRARERLGRRMQALYHLPPEKFQHVTAAGTPEQVAEMLAPYVEAGAGT